MGASRMPRATVLKACLHRAADSCPYGVDSDFLHRGGYQPPAGMTNQFVRTR